MMQYSSENMNTPINWLTPESVSDSLYWLLPELLLTTLILLLTILIISPVKSDKWQKGLVFFGIGLYVLVNGYFSYVLGETQIQNLFNADMLIVNAQAAKWKILLGLSMLVVLLFPLPLTVKRPRGEYFLLLTGVLLGASLLVIANHFMMVLISLEMISLTSYLLTGLARTRYSAEAAVKYFLFGAAATAVMVYGVSWLYGITGHVSLSGSELAMLENNFYPDWVPFLVVTLISSGILFKVAVAPWHIWVPDVYEQTPTPVVAMFSVIPKLAGFAFLIKWIAWLEWPVEEVAVLAVLTMSVGNFAALRQVNVKRMMGYSSIAHSGFLMMALLFPGDASVLFFYAAVYIFMNLGAFLLINYYERMYRIQLIKEYDGFFRISPLFGIYLVVFMVALTGLPPTAGFTAKLFLFSAVLAQFQESGSALLMFTFVFGIINAVVSFAYYVRIPYGMIFRDMHSSVNIFKKYSVLENFLCLFLVLAVLLLFFKPEWLMGWINNSSFAF